MNDPTAWFLVAQHAPITHTALLVGSSLTKAVSAVVPPPHDRLLRSWHDVRVSRHAWKRWVAGARARRARFTRRPYVLLTRRRVRTDETPVLG